MTGTRLEDGSYIVDSFLSFDGMCWPNPDDPKEIEWQLRYGDPVAVRFVAASYVSAYRALLEQPQRRRNQIISRIHHFRDVARTLLHNDSDSRTEWCCCDAPGSGIYCNNCARPSRLHSDSNSTKP